MTPLSFPLPAPPHEAAPDGNDSPCHAAGFTLLETAIAMIVMMVVGLGATSLFIYAVRHNSGGNDRSLALALAQQRLEDLRGMAFTDAALNPGLTTTVELVSNALDESSAGGAQSGAGYQAASATGSNSMSRFRAATPAPTPFDHRGGGGASELPPAPAGSRYFQVETQVDALPFGSAAPTQKRITVRITPVNNAGQDSWLNRNPVVITIRRSGSVTGPYKAD